MYNFHKTDFPRHSTHQIFSHFGITIPTYFISLLFQIPLRPQSAPFSLPLA
nr:MAG TPA: hypothetical protein [Caudoviricetes sp.]